jgi:UDP-glucose 4-epimerase
VLLTGASGFIGRHVLDALGDAHEVVALAGRRGLPADLTARCARVLAGDLTDETLLREALTDVAGVCHLAARIPANHADPSEAESCVRVNALATLRLAQLSVEQGVGRFVFASTGALYAPGTQSARESDPVFPAARATYYLGSKLLGELYVEHLRVTQGLPALTLRVASVYGPGMPAQTVVHQFVDNARAGSSLDVRHGGVPAADFVYVSDVSACVVAALERGDPGIYNVGAGQTWSLRELAERVVRVFASRSAVAVTPPEGPVPPGFPALSVAKAQATWGFAPLSLDEGLDRLRAHEMAA